MICLASAHQTTRTTWPDIRSPSEARAYLEELRGELAETTFSHPVEELEQDKTYQF